MKQHSEGELILITLIIALSLGAYQYAPLIEDLYWETLLGLAYWTTIAYGCLRVVWQVQNFRRPSLMLRCCQLFLFLPGSFGACTSLILTLGVATHAIHDFV